MIFINVEQQGQKEKKCSGEGQCLWCGDDWDNCGCVEHSQMCRDIRDGLSLPTSSYGSGYPSQRSRVEAARELQDTEASV